MRGKTACIIPAGWLDPLRPSDQGPSSMLAKMTPTQARYAVESVLRQHASFAGSRWHVVAEREPRHELSSKICVSVFPEAFCEGTKERLAEVARILSQHLDREVETRNVPLSLDADTDARHTPGRPAVHVWLD
jgi:hypothetical protein